MPKSNIQPLRGPRTLIRSLHASDLEMTRTWRNHPETRIHFFHSDEISPQQHQAWYESYLRRDDDHVFIVELLTGGVPLAQTSLYRIDHASQTAEFGRFIVGDVRMRGAGFGRESLGMTCRVGFDLFDLEKITLEVKPDNKTAIKSYLDTGFAESTANDDKLQMSLSRRQWQQHASAFSY